MKLDTVSVIGLGYIGLPTAAMFASCGKNVIGVDVNKSAVDTITLGKIHIVEPGLDGLVSRAVSDGNLRAVLSPEPADAFLIAVPTPFVQAQKDCNGPVPDLSYIESAVRSIAKVLEKGNLVILESTSPVGTTEKVSEWLAAQRADLTFPHTHFDASDVRVAYCPERVLPGQVIKELTSNDRVIGGLSTSCSEAAIELYSAFVTGELRATTSRTAEMAKLTENASRDVNIAFANELSVICDDLDIDVWELIAIANRHPRVNILQPGPGVGGHCIAVDPWFIVSKTPEKAKLIRTAREINDSKPLWVIDRVAKVVNQLSNGADPISEENVVIACYGLSFKPNIDDLRESPALFITREIARRHAGKVFAVEPNIQALQEEEDFELIPYSASFEQPHIIVILVNHSEFIDLQVSGAQILIDTVQGRNHRDIK